MKRFPSLFPAALAFSALAFLADQVQAQVFIVAIPEVQVIQSNSSSLHNTLGDAAGNTLYVVEHRRTIDLGGGETETRVAGYQWVLVTGKGKIVATKEFIDGSDIPIREVFFSSRRILAQVDSGNGVFVEGFRPVDGTLESEGILVALDGVDGGVTRQATQKPPSKFFDVDISTNGKVSSIRRFDVTKLKSLAN